MSRAVLGVLEARSFWKPAAGHLNEADLSMRLGAVRWQASVRRRGTDRGVGGVIDRRAGPGDEECPRSGRDRSVRVGQARLGLEASGVGPAGCECSLTSFVRAFARRDWGDGATGAGLELVAGVRLRNLPRRLGIDAGAIRSAKISSLRRFVVHARLNNRGYRRACCQADARYSLRYRGSANRGDKMTMMASHSDNMYYLLLPKRPQLRIGGRNSGT